MHPNSYPVASSGFKRHFGQYLEGPYYPNTLPYYTQENEKYYQSWPEWPSMPIQVPIEPHKHDVLMGRGGRNNQHSGNDILRQFGRVQGDNYRVATKKGKSAISRLLVKQMRELNPPARFLRRVQQTAAWEEVSEETAREKASQVLRDAVAGLFDEKDDTNRDHEDHSSVQPLPTVSAPISNDEHDQSPPVRRQQHRQMDFYPPESNKSSPDRKRRRNTADLHPIDALDEPLPLSNRRVPVVGCSPIRRHTEQIYSTGYMNDNRYGHAPSYHPSIPLNNATIQRPTPNNPSVGNLDEFALLHGELLESDVEDDSFVPRKTRKR